MNERAPARLYVVAITSLALLVVGLVLTANESKPTLAAILSGVGALGMFACAWIVKRHQNERS
jgi:uncharacterized membrane protein